MNKELIEQLSVITEEEQRYLDGMEDIDKKIYMSKDSMIVDSKKLLERGKLIEIRPHTRFIHFPEHRHNFIEMTYMLKGSTTHYIDKEKVILSEGDIIFLNQNATQEILPADKDTLAINFIIQPEFFDKALQMLEGNSNILYDFIISAIQNEGDSKYIYFHAKGLLTVENLLENMIWTIKNKINTNRGITQTTMGLLLLHLSNHTDLMKFGNSSYESKLGLKVVRYIEEQYRDAELSVIAEELGYEMYWLSRQIKKITGKNFKELLLEKRLKQAEYLLKETNLSVLNVIYKVGYTNTSYFYRIFTKKFGLSPKEYRKFNSK